MLDRSKVVNALQSKREQFTTYQSEQRRQSSQASDKLAQFGQLTAAAVRQALADRNVEWPGAEPTPELDQAQQLRLPFAQRWTFARRCAGLGAWQFWQIDLSLQ